MSRVCFQAFLLLLQTEMVFPIQANCTNRANSKAGSFSYTKTIGVQSLSMKKPMQQNSILGMASCTKLLIAVCALRCIEKGLLDLDADVAPILPEVGKFGVITSLITSFDDNNNEGVFEPKAGPVTLRSVNFHL